MAAIVLGFLFRIPLTRLLNRVDSVKSPAFEVRTTENAARDQVEAAEKSSKGDDQLVKKLATQPELPLTGETAERRRAVMAYGGTNEAVHIAMRDIVLNLQAIGFALDSDETTQLLIRHLGVTQLLYQSEKLYRLIFGSQLTAMRFMNEAGSQSEDTLRSIYNAIKDQHAEFYKDFPFEHWIGFLIGSLAVAHENGAYGISVFGREFLGWVAETGLAPKPF